MGENLSCFLSIFDLVVASAERNGAEGSHEEDETSDDGDGTDRRVVSVVLLEGLEAVLGGLAFSERLGHVEERNLAEAGALKLLLEVLEEENATILDELLELRALAVNALASGGVLTLSTGLASGLISLGDNLVVAIDVRLVAVGGHFFKGNQAGLSSCSGVKSSERLQHRILVLGILNAPGVLIARAGLGAHEVVDVLLVLSSGDLLEGLAILDGGIAGLLVEGVTEVASHDSATSSEGKDADDKGEDEVHDGGARVGPLAKAEAEQTNDDAEDGTDEAERGGNTTLRNVDGGLVILHLGLPAVARHGDVTVGTEHNRDDDGKD